MPRVNLCATVARMKNSPAALGWLGIALILAPIALFCAFVAVAVTPQAGFILLVVVLAYAAGKIANRKKG